MQNYNVVFMGTSKFAVPILEGLLESSVTIQAVFSAPPKAPTKSCKDESKVESWVYQYCNLPT